MNHSASRRTLRVSALASLSLCTLALMACSSTESGAASNGASGSSFVGAAASGAPGAASNAAPPGAPTIAGPAGTPTPTAPPVATPVSPSEMPPAGSPPSKPKSGNAGGIDYTNPQIRVITPAEEITSLPYGRIRTETTVGGYSIPLLYDQFTLTARDVGDGFYGLFAVVSNVADDLSGYTGFRPIEPIGAWQRGRSSIGSESAFQLQGTSAGSFINTAPLRQTFLPFGTTPSSTFGIHYSAPTTPYRHPSSELTVQALVRVPASSPLNGAYGQMDFVIALRDRTSGHTFAYEVAIWDSRPLGQGNGSESIAHEGVTHTIRAPMRPDAQDANSSPFSAQLRNQITWRSGDFFRVHVPAWKLLRTIARVQTALPGVVLSNTAADYELVTAGIRQRVVIGTDPTVNMLMGSSVSDLSIYEFY